MSRRMLIVEDEPIVLLDLTMAAEDAGFEVYSATSATAALKVLDNGGVDVAVLDVNLGGGQTCLPIARRLDSDGVPYLVQTGDLDRAGEAVRGLTCRILAKPTRSATVVSEAAALLPR